MANDNAVDAVWISEKHPDFYKSSRLARLAGALFGIKPGEGTVNILNGLVNAGRLIRRDPTDPGYHWPKEHTNSGTERHEWVDVPNRPGVKVGYLIDDPDEVDITEGLQIPERPKAAVESK